MTPTKYKKCFCLWNGDKIYIYLIFKNETDAGYTIGLK